MKDLQHCNTSDDAKNINSRPLPSPVEETRNSPVARPTASKTSKNEKKGSPLPVDAVAKSKNEMKELQKCSSCGLKYTKVYLRPLPLYYSTGGGFVEAVGAAVADLAVDPFNCATFSTVYRYMSFFVTSMHIISNMTTICRLLL